MLTNRLVPGALVAVLALAACGGATTTQTPPTAAPTPRPTPTAVPGDPGGNTGGGGSGGSGGVVTDPGTGGGTDPIPGDGANDNPLFGNATYLQPSQGLINQRTVNVQLVRAVLNADGTVTADLRWWSGVAPCSQLDHVEIVADEAARTIHLKVIEGSGGGDIACIDIAQLSATAVDLGVLSSGAWTISAEGDAPAITLEVK